MAADILYNESQLIADLKMGSQAAFTQLYNHYSQKIYFNVLAMVKDELIAEELVQDIFSTIWQKKASINIETSFAGYLYTLSRNKVYDFFKQLDLNDKLYTNIKSIATTSYTHVEETLFSKENAHLLQEAINALPPQRRKVFELCKLKGLSYQQASEQMGVSVSTIKDHMAHARAAIKLFVANHPDMALSIVLFSLFNK